MHFLWLILILHMLLKLYSLKSNLSKLTSGPYFTLSIKFLKLFETTSCTSLTVPGKWLFHSHLNYTLKHQKNIGNLLGRDPSPEVKMGNPTILHWVFWAAFSEAWVQGEPPHQLAEPQQPTLGDRARLLGWFFVRYLFSTYT